MRLLGEATHASKENCREDSHWHQNIRKNQGVEATWQCREALIVFEPEVIPAPDAWSAIVCPASTATVWPVRLTKDGLELSTFTVRAVEFELR